MIVNGIEHNYIIHDDNNIKGFFGEYRWLSNFQVCDILWQGMGFTSTEAAYQASKTTNATLAKTFENYSPSMSKQQGRLLTTRKDWQYIKFGVMSQLIFQKFLQHKEMRDLLLATGDKYIEETNHWNDKYWGVCNGQGLNNLGKILMSTRAYFKELERLI